MFGVLADTKLFEVMVRKFLPRLAAHFDKIGLSLLLMTSQWFACLFIKTLPLESTFRVW